MERLLRAVDRRPRLCATLGCAVVLAVPAAYTLAAVLR